MPLETSLVLFEPHADPVRITPAAALGPQTMSPLRNLFGAAGPGAAVVLDLQRVPVSTPREIAAVLWADDEAASMDVGLEIVVGDVLSAELLDFAGVRAAVYSPASGRPSRAARQAARRRRASARPVPRRARR